MILVDTSVWIDHFRGGDPLLSGRLETGLVLGHPFIFGEIAMGSLRQRAVILDSLANLPQATLAQHEEVMALVESEKLFGLGIGYIDAHLLAATRLSSPATLWTRDKRLLAVADKLSLTTPAD